MQDQPVSRDLILYSPATFDRHDAAVRHVERVVQTRAPRADSQRFPDIKPGAWGLLASGDTISAGSGLALGSGTVTLCTLDGSTLTDTGQSVTVYNSGVPITASYGGKAVALEWTEAGWSACECGPDCAPCIPCCIPKKDLFLTLPAGASFPSGGTATLVFNGVGTWQSACIPTGPGGAGGSRFKLECPGGYARLVWTVYATNACTTVIIPSAECWSNEPFTSCDAITAWTCTPFHFVMPGASAVTFYLDE